jgi:hypothetical protein
MAVRVIEAESKDGKRVSRLAMCNFPTLSPDVVDQARKAAAARRDDMLSCQKEFGKDREFAKFFKNEASDALKEYRAACLILGLVACEPPGDSHYVELKNWPIDLAPWINRVAGQCEMASHG